MSFENKVVLVTGGSSGIGAKTAIQFAKEGARVAIVGRNEVKLASVEKEIIKVGSKPLIIKADVSKDDEANTIIPKTIAAFGKLDVLVNNAGILRKSALVDDNFLEIYDEVMNVNMRPVVIVTKQALSYLKETKGNIISVSSIAGLNLSEPGFLAYRASKAALTHFTRGVAVEVAPFGIRANVVTPGPVETSIFDSASLGVGAEFFEKSTLLGRVSEAEEVADMILYLAGNKARGVTGSNFVIDNGYLTK